MGIVESDQTVNVNINNSKEAGSAIDTACWNQEPLPRYPLYGGIVVTKRENGGSDGDDDGGDDNVDDDNDDDDNDDDDDGDGGDDVDNKI